MSDLVVLHNKGDFTIHCGGKAFKPKTTVSFPINLAVRLLRLYPGVIEDVVAATQLYKVEPETVAFDKKEGTEKKGSDKPAGGKPKEKGDAAGGKGKEVKTEEKAE